jgi:hypothetical protein
VPGGDGGNDSTLLAEALARVHGEGDGGCKGASSGQVGLSIASDFDFKSSATPGKGEEIFVEKGESNGECVEEEL